MQPFSNQYLYRLPEADRYIGSHQTGEIEIATTPEIEQMLMDAGKLTSDSEERTCPASSSLGIVFEDDYLLVVRDPVIFSNGKAGTYLRIFERSALTGKAGVVILPIRDGKIFFNRIFRHATRQWEIELPRGFRDEGCSLEQAVEIELSQEVGLQMESIESLGEIYPNTGLLSGSAQAYIVTLLPGEANNNPEAGESIAETLELTLKDVHQKIANGEIRDGFTLSTLYLAQVSNHIV